jgi:type IV pilus assembly protein PilC
MLTYTYTARNQQTGETIKAEVQADSEQAASRLLISQNLFPISIASKGAETKIFKLGQRVKPKDKVIFTRQLSTMINAGLPILQSLRTVQAQVNNKALKNILNQIVAEVEGGSSLANAFGKHATIFNQTYISLIAAGEASGSLDKTLERMSVQLEKDAALASKIRGAMIYPAIVLTVVVGVLTFLLTVVLPQISSIYKDYNKPLPPLTRVMLLLSTITVRFWWIVLLGLGAIGYGIITYVKTPSGRYLQDQVKLKIPIFGPLLRKVYMARFSRGFGTLLFSGLPVLNALEIVKRSINNRVIDVVLDEAMKDVRAGKALSDSLEKSPEFLPIVPQMLRIGEQSGALADIMERLSVYLENEIDEVVKNLTTALEPALMIFLGVTVGTIMAAVLLPIYGLVSGGTIQ